MHDIDARDILIYGFQFLISHRTLYAVEKFMSTSLQASQFFDIESSLNRTYQMGVLHP